MYFDLTPELLLRAYASGIFPMGDETGEIKWYSPNPRCIFDLDNFHIPKRLLRTYNQRNFEIGINSAWDQVIRQCSRRNTDSGVWITEPIIEAYTNLHKLGFAHSVETYMDGVLVGGLYGVCLRGAFMGESMFHTATDASKIALVFLVQRMKERNYKLLDTQFSTSHLRTFGASLVSREEYLERLREAMKLDCSFVP